MLSSIISIVGTLAGVFTLAVLLAMADEHLPGVNHPGYMSADDKRNLTK